MLASTSLPTIVMPSALLPCHSLNTLAHEQSPIGLFAQYDVHLWQINLDDEWGEHGLDQDEQAKAARYLAPTRARHYRHGRVALRALLGLYLQCPPEQLRFSYNAFGKPALLDHALHFNLSHSSNLALIAIARQPLGVDIEDQRRQLSDLDGMLDMVCHPSEKALLGQSAPPQRHARFYRLWTQKEAYCKALGCGLQQSLPALRLAQVSHENAAQIVRDEQLTDYWIHPIAAPTGFAASLCMQKEDLRIGEYIALPSGQERQPNVNSA